MQDWSSLIDVDKRVIPKIIVALEKPKYPSVIYPSLIPLLSQLPIIQKLKDMSSQESNDVINFFKNLLNSLKTGAEKEIGFGRKYFQSSPSDNGTGPSVRTYGVNINALKSCVQTFFDCTLYYSQVVGQYHNQESSDPINKKEIFQEVRSKN